ncbi:MAG: lipid II flippase MurJ [Acidimicrobiales bacterium]
MTDLNRSARLMAVLTVVSRLSGFARVMVFTWVFGKSYLANTYVSSNTVPNILFELFAAGALQAVLVPTMVRLMPSAAAGREGLQHPTEAERVAGTVVGLLCGVLAFVGVVAVAFGPQVMRLLVDDVPSARIRQDEVELGALFLWFFMPQLVFYGANVVATAVLNARNRFALPVFAPTLNNVVVIGAYLWFDAVHTGPLTLDLTSAETWIVAGGTTLAVVVFCALPVLAVWREGFSLRPRFEVRQPAIVALLREGAWAGVFLALTQVVQVVILKVANREAGAPTVYQFAFILFTLPHALFSVPVMTTRFPQMSRAAQAGDWVDYRRTVAIAVRSIAFLALAASAVSIAVAGPGAELLAYGKGASLAPRIAAATMAFAPGIVGFGLLLFFTRALYATTDARTPALVNLGLVVVTSVVMLTAVPLLSNRDLVTGLAGAFAVGNLGGALALGWIVDRRLEARSAGTMHVAAPVTRSLVAAVVAAGLGWLAGDAVGWATKPAAVLAVAAGASVAIVVFVGIQWALGGPGPQLALRTLGAGDVP